jgi:hypothetical protein
VAGWVVGASLAFGSLLGLAVFVRAGALGAKEAVVLPAVAAVTTTLLALIFVVAPELRRENAPLYLAASLYCLNMFTYSHYALVLMFSGTSLKMWFDRYSRRTVVADMQATMLLLGLTWLATMGAF